MKTCTSRVFVSTYVGVFSYSTYLSNLKISTKKQLVLSAQYLVRTYVLPHPFTSGIDMYCVLRAMVAAYYTLTFVTKKISHPP